MARIVSLFLFYGLSQPSLLYPPSLKCYHNFPARCPASPPPLGDLCRFPTCPAAEISSKLGLAPPSGCPCRSYLPAEPLLEHGAIGQSRSSSCYSRVG
jgi:hypothetical protein